MSAEIEPGWRRASKYSVCKSQGKQLLSTKWYGQEKGVVKGKQNKTGCGKKKSKSTSKPNIVTEKVPLLALWRGK